VASAPISPVTFSFADYQRNTIAVTLNFNNATLVLTSVTTTRTAACVYHNIYFGLGANGIPDTSSKAFGGVPAGTATASAALLASLGFSTVTDVLSGQITAGP